MQAERGILFSSFRLDLVDERLWQDSQAIFLRKKAFAVLRYLVEHAGQLVTKEEVLRAVWPGTYVSDTVLKVCLQEIRAALGDAARSPQCIQTVHGRGYRFIATITTAPLQSLESRVPRRVSERQDFASSVQTLDPRRQTLDVPLVGREAELDQLSAWLGKALDGERQLVFVTGEPGIGKTTLVEAFLDSAAQQQEVWIGRGQCILSTQAEAEAEVCFRKAIEIARRQSAKSLELRAATSLARLWQQQGRRAEAYELLASVYNWFTEGFDTANLQDAKALLTELT